MRFTRTSKALGMVAIAALALTGCGAGGGSNEGASDAAGDPAKIITAYSNEPQNPLLPANTNEVYGGRVVELLFEGLTSYSPSGESVNALTTYGYDPVTYMQETKCTLCRIVAA